MEKLTNWLQLWKELVEVKARASKLNPKSHDKSYCNRKARQFKKKAESRGSNIDSSRQFIASTLKANPGSTLLDIGAGIGDWSVFLGSYASEVTALEPSAAMGELLVETIKSSKAGNVKWVQGTWPGIHMEPHDYTLASHSMYGETDIKPFIEKMNSISRKGCFLVTRVLYTDTIMAKAAQRVLGQPYDSPCFQVIYNVLLQLGFCPNVLMETGKTWKSWSNDSMDEALEDIKTRLGVQHESKDDEYLLSLLSENLVEKNGKFTWPSGNGSSLIYWGEKMGFFDCYDQPHGR